jgi:hypothetical protein
MTDPHSRRPLDTSDLDPERYMHLSAYCGRCGYNLRYQSYVGRCSECGNAYNARPTVRSGIFDQTAARWPGAEFVVLVMSLGGAVFFLLGAIDPPNWYRLGAAVGCLMVAALSIRSIARCLGAIRLHRQVVARIEEDRI